MTEYIQPELLILVPVLYLIAEAIKASKLISNKYIPIVIGIIGILLSLQYVHDFSFVGIFTGITQGILCAGASTYANQIYKQLKKDK